MTDLQVCRLQLREVQKIWQLVKDEEELTKAISQQLVREEEAKLKGVKVKRAKQQQLLRQKREQQQELTEEEQQQLKVIIYKTS